VSDDQPIPRDRIVGLVTLIAVTFVVLSVMTLGPSRLRLGAEGHDRAPAPAPTSQRISAPAH
jgi:hypothetical protein